MKNAEQAVCPLCQQLNQCAVLVGKGIEQCWCHNQDFPDKEAISAAELPLQDQACVCKVCIDKLKNTAQAKVKEIVYFLFAYFRFSVEVLCLF